MRPQSLPSNQNDTAGFSLLELLIAVLLLMMISVMIYSVLNVGIKFSHQGETRLLSLAKEQGFLALLHQQIGSAVYDRQKRKVEISADDDMLRIVTKRPLLFHDVGLVLAIYRFNAAEQTIFYIEKKDFYNPDFDTDYLPDFDEMLALVSTEKDFLLEYDSESGQVTVEYEDGQYTFTPRCWPQEI